MRARPAGPGPIVWACNLLATALLLLALQRVLWLVIPFLLAIILYYMLYAPVQGLVFSGWSREAATGLVAGGFFAVAIVAVVLAMPWLTAKAVNAEEWVTRYLDGGKQLLERTLVGLEDQLGFLRRARLAEGVGREVERFGETFAQEHLTGTLLTIAAWVPSLLLAPFIAFFLLRDGRRFGKFVTRAVPNAYFEKTLYLLDQVDETARNYFGGLLKLTFLDTVCLAVGLWAIGVSAPLLLGLIAAVFAWVPFVGSIAGAVVVVLVAATDFPNRPEMAYWAIALFIGVRLLDDFVFMPLTVGRSLHMHPFVTVLMIFVGGAVAGVPGLLLVLPLTGIVMVVGGTIGQIVTDPRLRARHAHARALQARRASADLGP